MASCRNRSNDCFCPEIYGGSAVFLCVWLHVWRDWFLKWRMSSVEYWTSASRRYCSRQVLRSTRGCVMEAEKADHEATRTIPITDPGIRLLWDRCAVTNNWWRRRWRHCWQLNAINHGARWAVLRWRKTGRWMVSQPLNIHPSPIRHRRPPGRVTAMFLLWLGRLPLRRQDTWTTC